ncbi:MAG: LysR family transcriptional regulator [Myxococcota bacterium]
MKWAELRSAWMVAKLGSVSAAAKQLGIHRSTVSRHLDDLEAHLGASLFLRNPKGVVPTEDGLALIELGDRADGMFSEFAGRLSGRRRLLTGTLKVSVLPGLSHLLMPALRRYQELHPRVHVEVLADRTLAHLEYGEAQVALRAGPKPEHRDYVVKVFRSVRLGLYASEGYLERFGRPLPASDPSEHRWVSLAHVGSAADRSAEDGLQAPGRGLSTNDHFVNLHAIVAGVGIGWLAEHDAARFPTLVRVDSSGDPAAKPLWVVTHVDANKDDRVRDFRRVLLEA